MNINDYYKGSATLYKIGFESMDMDSDISWEARQLWEGKLYGTPKYFGIPKELEESQVIRVVKFEDCRPYCHDCFGRGMIKDPYWEDVRGPLIVCETCEGSGRVEELHKVPVYTEEFKLVGYRRS